MTIFYGQEYAPAIASFRILLLSVLINYPATIFSNALFAYNQQKAFIKYATLGALSNVIFNALLIPLWGIEGAAVSTLLTQIASNAFVGWKMKQVNEFSIVDKMGKTLLAGLALGVFVYALHWWQINFFVNVTLAIIVYFAILQLLKEPVIADVKALIYARPSH
jgi:O-antigen/teichoic acid export membrane protein